MRPVVIGVLFRRNRMGFVDILTQRRIVKNKSYDPLYDGTWEAMGETVEEGESVIDALIRGVAEECGVPGFKPVQINGGGLVWSTDKNDRILASTPLCFVQSLGPPQPWLGPAFLVEVGGDFEPNQENNDGEAGAHRWWNPPDLEEAASKKPGSFMGLHLPALVAAARRLNPER